ncbi:MAG: hypothetical protein NT122_00375 [Solirubrobacterales bacterium]|nr:hypothetical protein [Solirubrobacterales bacterium]
MLTEATEWIDWLEACRRMRAGIERMLVDNPTTKLRAIELGRGEGGDRTLAVDAAAEDLIFAELEQLHADGMLFTAVSEERGEVDFGGGDVRVVIDPIDGSLNAKRCAGAVALSVAVANGPTVADVQFGFVHDFGMNEEWVAVAGGGAWLNGSLLDPSLPARRSSDGKLEIIGIESTNPVLVTQASSRLEGKVHRLRALGAIAVTLCQVAAARSDAMVSLGPCRSVDAAAAQLVVREAGGVVSFPAFDHPLAAPLDLLPHSPVAAGRDIAALELVAAVPQFTPAQ